jgi:hypothetical protein
MLRESDAPQAMRRRLCAAPTAPPMNCVRHENATDCRNNKNRVTAYSVGSRAIRDTPSRRSKFIRPPRINRRENIYRCVRIFMK